MIIHLTPTKLADAIPQGDNPIGEFSPQSKSGYLPPTDPASLATNTTNILSNIIGFITLIAGIGFIFYFMLGAINWITAAGDTNKAQLARTMIINALIGLVITLIAYPAIQIISQLLGVPLANPGELFYSLFT